MGSHKTNIAVHFELKQLMKKLKDVVKGTNSWSSKKETLGNPLAWGQRGVQLQRGAGWQMLRDLQSGPRWRVA